MKLSLYSDYALRMLIHLAARPDELARIRDIAQVYGISHNHLTKIVQDLGQAGFITTLRGRNGGLRLARPAAHITLGDVLRHTEGICLQLECATCIIAPACTLPAILGQAMQAFIAVLDGYSIQDLVSRPQDLDAIFGQR